MSHNIRVRDVRYFRQDATHEKWRINIDSGSVSLRGSAYRFFLIHNQLTVVTLSLEDNDMPLIVIDHFVTH